MVTTFEVYATKRLRNYSSRPTIDVEILDDTRECGAEVRGGTCDIEVQYNLTAGRWEHDPAEVECEGHESLAGGDMGASVYCDGSCRPESKHRPTPKLMCTYCHTQDPDEVKTAQHAWYDAVECSRCGGVEGWALGD